MSCGNEPHASPLQRTPDSMNKTAARPCHTRWHTFDRVGRLALLLGWFVPTWALGQPMPNDQVRSSASQALFETGRQLMQEERFSEACVKLAESQRLDPQAGTLINLALCHEKEGKTATAWLEYNDVLALAHAEDSERKEIARARIEALGESLSRLILLLPNDPPKDFWIELDGVQLRAGAYENAGIPVDPGPHVVRLGAAGKQTATLNIQVGPTMTRVPAQLPQLADLVPPTRGSPRSASEPARDMRLRWIVNGTVLGLGVAGIALGSYLGLRAQSDWDRRNQHCRAGCDAEAVAGGANAQRAATLSTVTIATGLVALGLGTYLVITTPDGGRHRARVQVGASATPQGASIVAGGYF
jgi:hypothetical protein